MRKLPARATEDPGAPMPSSQAYNEGASCACPASCPDRQQQLEQLQQEHLQQQQQLLRQQQLQQQQLKQQQQMQLQQLQQQQQQQKGQQKGQQRPLPQHPMQQVQVGRAACVVRGDVVVELHLSGLET